ncbi:ribonuclease H-like domain-containing protein [Tanacetum coccineum]
MCQPLLPFQNPTQSPSKILTGNEIDVKNTFLHGSLFETFYMYQLSGFRDPQCSDHVSLLQRSLYGLKQAPRAWTPIDTEAKLGVDGTSVSDPTLYKSLAGALQYLTFTRPDLSYAVWQVCLYMHYPREPHLATFKRILRYVRGTLIHGLQLYSSSTSSMVAYSNVDWTGCPTTRRSTSGYCVFLGNNLLSWLSKRQYTLSHSSAEVEYRGVANAVAEIVIYLSSNPMQHQCTKHIEIDIHFVRDQVTIGHVRVLHVPSRYQYADIFTKGLPSALFDGFRTSERSSSSRSNCDGLLVD